MDASMNVGRRVLVVAYDGVDHGARFGRGGRVVEESQRPPCELARKERDLRPHGRSVAID
jgi:hypothetical protein